MSRTEEILVKRQAVITNDHFVYASKKHGSIYVNKDAAYTRGVELHVICMEMARLYIDTAVDVVVGPEMGGIKLSDRIGENLAEYTCSDVVSITAEKLRKENGELVKPDRFTFKRGYASYIPGKRVLIAEDVVTTGGSVRLVAECVHEHGGVVVGAVAMCNRGGVKAEDIGIPLLRAVMNPQIESYDADKCPMCAAGVPVNTVFGKGKELLAKKAQDKAQFDHLMGSGYGC